MTELLRADSLRCERDQRDLFADLSFTVNAGDIVHVTGANGAGKTTLLRALLGLGWLAAGKVHWHRDLCSGHEELDAGCLWYIAHRSAVTLNLTPLENLTFALALHAVTLPAEQLWRALAIAGLSGFEDIPAVRLSAGQRRRVALARLYLELSSIRLWLLDEPYTALDAKAVVQLGERITDYAARGGAVILTSHQPLPHAASQQLSLETPGC